MEDYTIYLEKEILSFINSNPDKKIKFEKSIAKYIQLCKSNGAILNIANYIKLCESNFANDELNEFITNINNEIKTLNPNLDSTFVQRTEKNIEVGKTPIFSFKGNGITEHFIECLKVKDKLLTEIKLIAN